MKLLRRAPRKRAKEERKVVRRRVAPPTVREVFTAFSLTFFEKPGKALAKTFEFDKVLTRAGLAIHPVKYSAETISLTILTTLFTVVAATLFTTIAKPPLLTKVIAVLVALMIPIMVFTYRFAYPYLRASMRRNDVNNELPFFMAYVATMARGGYSLEKVIERVANLRVFKAVREESRKIITRIKMFGEDPITALDSVALAHPSSRFRDIILGYTTTLRSGGDVLHYLEIRTRELFEARAREVREVLNRLMSFLEVYTIFGVIVSLTVFVFFAVQGAITAAQQMQRGGMAMSIDVATPMLYNFLVLPMLGFSIMLAVHINQPRTPVNYNEVYATVFTFIPISLALFFAVLIVFGGVEIFMAPLTLSGVKALIIALAVALEVVSIPGWLRYRALVKGYRGFVQATADFLRDLSEVRKTGLSPERCIILLSQRSYRGLTRVIERAAAALSVGFSLEDALRKALKGVREWFTVAAFRFLTDSIVVGGGSPEVVDTLARFMQTLSELEEETRRRMRTQVILPYFGSVLLSSIPVILLYMLLALAKIPVEAATPLILVMMTGAIFNSFIMGLIAGKASQATLAAGFIHAAILVALSTAVSTATLLFIGA